MTHDTPPKKDSNIPGGVGSSTDNRVNASPSQRQPLQALPPLLHANSDHPDNRASGSLSGIPTISGGGGLGSAATGTGSGSMPSGSGVNSSYNSDQDDNNSIGSQQSLQRRSRQGKNVLKNANRRRRHTMEDKHESGGNSNPTSLQRLPEEPWSPAKSKGNGDNGSSSGGGNGSASKSEAPRPLRTDNSGESIETAPYVPSEQQQQKPRKPRPIAGRRASAESAQQLKEQRLKEQRADAKADKAVQREERRRRVAELQAKREEEEEVLFTGKAWSRQLNSAWCEVELLLQRPIANDEDLQYTVAAAEAGMMFTDQLSSAAKSLGVLRGALSRWLLPYDSSTRLDEQASTAHGVIDSMPDEFRGKLTERQVHYLVAGANSVRKLVRIKIADDNDLEQARQALKTAIAFFKTLQETSAQHSMTPFGLFEQRVRM